MYIEKILDVLDNKITHDNILRNFIKASLVEGEIHIVSTVCKTSAYRIVFNKEKNVICWYTNVREFDWVSESWKIERNEGTDNLLSTWNVTGLCETKTEECICDEIAIHVFGWVVKYFVNQVRELTF